MPWDKGTTPRVAHSVRHPVLSDPASRHHRPRHQGDDPSQTTIHGLLALNKWLKAPQAKTLALEATGVASRP
jgi:hypothetical protein